MSVDIGIIGLTKSGKTSVFNALTGVRAATTSPAPHIGVAKVPDQRLKGLADLLHPRKVVPTEVRFIDSGASAGGQVESRGIGGELLAQLSNADVLAAVVRAFRDESIPHSEGSLDIKRDVAAIGLELAVSDLAILERRLARIEESLKGAKPPERPHLLHERETVLKLRTSLEKDMPIRELTLSPDEEILIANFQLLTAKPLLIAVNVDEEQLAGAGALEAQLDSEYSRQQCRAIALCGKLEMELVQLDEAMAGELRAEYNLRESGRERAIGLAYELLGLVSFFTTASEEVKAWPIPDGTSALRAAGKIHTDMERGFIRAEVIGYGDLIGCGGFAEARKQGRLRLEGKSYLVRDGDVITFLFNI